MTPVKTKSSETISNTASCSSCYRMTPVKTRSSETISNTAICSSCYHIDPSQNYELRDNQQHSQLQQLLP
ncbi:hypothetical protein DPMN_019932 [Dreissena polymorpha]|uniref:Uncharacterized protein n=1 Tax=Dreissena polymorpha TaxID=45954 RepID=A0A9D4NLU3_DREPO|nr:hypothetical protein DPMN_019932 [Dreissena polymorpha]